MNRNKKIVIDPIKNDLVFQIVSWYSVDYEYDDDVENEYDDASKYLIKVFGNTENGASVALNILNYTPYFYIKVNHKCDKYTSEHIHEYVVGKLPRKLKNSLIDVTLLKKKDFWGFTNNEKFIFARLKFKNINAYKSSIRLFYKAVLITSISKEPIKYKLYESNIDPFLRMMHIRDIQPCGWVELKKSTYEQNTCNLPSSCQIDIECDWKSVMKYDKEKIAPILVASFDLECTSSHGDFPIARKNYAKVSYEMLQYFNAHKHDDYIKDTIQKELLKIFIPSSEGIFSKVFPKYEVKIQDLENKIKKVMDELFTILTGRLNYKKPLNVKTNYFGYSNDDNVDEEKGMDKDAIMIMLTQKLGDFDEEKGWIGIFPQLEGDQIIQIGTTTHCYGEKECNYKSILTLGSCDPIEGVEVIACESEKELLMKWRDLIIKLDPDVITGYNIFGFDMHYLYYRSKELGICTDFCKLGRLMGHKCEYVEKNLSSSALGDNLLKFIEMEGRVLIDVMKVVQRDHKLDSYKLDNVASHFMKMNKNDVHPSDIFKLQKGSSADRRTIADYCVQDCALCNHLIMKLEILANNIGMSNVCNVPLAFIFMRGQGIKIFSLTAKECRSDDFLIPTLSNFIRDNDSDVVVDEEGYEGAIVLEAVSGIYTEDPISVLDYASLYPSSMISENLSHDSIILNKKYDNLPGIEYLDIVYDVYEKIDDKKVKTGEKTVRFAQFPNGEKGTIPKILMKLLRQRKETRKKMEFKTVITHDDIEHKGLLKEKDDKVIITGLDGKSIEFLRENIKTIEDTYDDFQKAVLDGLQLAYKVTANSLYGQCGAKTSSIYMKEIAACTTATGRKMILMAKDFIEKNYSATTIYGDTDSIFIQFDIKDETGNPIKGKNAIMPSIKMAMDASKKFKQYLKVPHDLEYEKCFYPFILFSKKRYCAMKYEFDDQHCKFNSMGISLKRRDSAQIVKHIYGGCIDIILKEHDIKKSIEFLKESLNNLIDNKFPLEDLVISKSLRGNYKDPTRIAHKVLADRMSDRDPGNKPQVSDRIPYVYIQVKEEKGKTILQGNRIEAPDFIKKNKLKPDYEFYINNQIMKPILQLYALILEDLEGYRKGKNYYSDMYPKLLKEKNDDEKKAKDRFNDLRETDVKTLLFDPLLTKLNNKKNGMQDISKFFQKK
jgi:DNA polymerase elongation subunit (family B)